MKKSLRIATLAFLFMSMGITLSGDTGEKIANAKKTTAEDILRDALREYAKHDFDTAIELCESALKKTEDRTLIGQINYALSSSYLEKGIPEYKQTGKDTFFNLAIEHAQKVLEVFPESWQALANLGSVFFNMKDWERAIPYLLEAQRFLDETDPNYQALELQYQFASEMLKKNNLKEP